MKTKALISYMIGSILLVISCLTGSVTVTWLLSGMAIAILFIGCIFQYAGSKNTVYAPSVIKIRNHHLPR